MRNLPLRVLKENKQIPYLCISTLSHGKWEVGSKANYVIRECLSSMTSKLINAYVAFCISQGSLEEPVKPL